MIPWKTFGQENFRWSVRLGNRLLWSADREDTAAHTVHGPLALNHSEAGLIIQVTDKPESGSRPAWIRYFGLFDERDSEWLRVKDRNTLAVTSIFLKDFFRRRARLTVFSWVIPRDPRLAAQIRIRRVHLCSFVTD
ncbi:MAG TPA: hypothetical protein VG870_04645 [Chitinophagaceae bacterium]|nr:hypothetical protein [Chitinophagaceae bacterium]